MSAPAHPGSSPHRSSTEPAWVRYLLITVTLGYLGLFLLMPLICVFYEALGKGLGGFFDALKDPDSVSSIELTLIVAAIAVPLNTVFGLAAGWCLGKFNFIGKSVIITLIDIPFAVSPVISGLIFILLFGRQGWWGHWLAGVDFHYPWLAWRGFSNGFPLAFTMVHQQGLKVVFAIPGIVMATTFVTFPFAAREVMALMQEQGIEEEQAALVLGASGWQTFRYVTLPNIKWALIYGIILTNARAMGEFGAVAVVSGRIVGKTNTMPLQVEAFYSSDYVSAFALSSLLALLALVTLILKTFVEWQARRAAKKAAEDLG